MSWHESQIRTRGRDHLISDKGEALRYMLEIMGQYLITFFDTCGGDLNLVVNTTNFVPRPDEGRDWIEILLDVCYDEEAIEYVVRHLMDESDIHSGYSIFVKDPNQFQNNGNQVDEM